MRSPNGVIVRAATRDPKILARFWASVDRGPSAHDCWESRDGRAYGRHPVFRVKHHAVSAARLAWFAATGEFPLGGRIRHTCQNVACVRPEHLRWDVGRRTEQMLRGHSNGYVPVAAIGSGAETPCDDASLRRAG